MDSDIELYIEVSIEKMDGGRQQAKLARLPAQPEGDHKPECIRFRAWYPVQSDNDHTTPIKSAHLATVWLYWPEPLPNEKICKRVYRYLDQNIRKFLRMDEFFRIAIPAQLKSTGFYFTLSGSC